MSENENILSRLKEMLRDGIVSICEAVQENRNTADTNIQNFRTPLIERFKLDIKEIRSSDVSGDSDSVKAQYTTLYNLIGLDFGDGEISACRVYYSAMDKKLTTTRLTLSTKVTLLKAINMVTFLSNGKACFSDSIDAVSEERIFYNFKRCPGKNSTGNMDARYLTEERDDKGAYIEDERTYKEIMIHGFAALVENLFHVNEASLDRSKPTIILVGRPSSEGWEDSEYEYAKLLESELEHYLPDNQAKVQVAVQAESTAALAFETLPAVQRGNGVPEQVILVIDCGSSTFDITVITPNGIPVNGEDSYRFGGSDLDANIVSYGDYLYEKAYPAPEYRLPEEKNKKLKLRIKKQDTYGTLGKSDMSAVYIYLVEDSEGNRVIDQNGYNERFRYELSPQTMHAVLSNQEGLPFLKVSVRHENGKAEENANIFLSSAHFCNSWLDGCKYVMEQFRDNTKKFYTKKNKEGQLIPHQIIITGGVANMPEVRRIAENVFLTDVRVSDEPNYTVCDGLGMVLGNEILKRFLVEELMDDLDKNLPDSNTLWETILNEGINEDIKSIEQAVEDWCNRPGSLSFEDYDSIFEKYFIRGFGFVVRGSSIWYSKQKINSMVDTALRKKFEQLFPAYKKEFYYKCDTPDMTKLKDISLMVTNRSGYFFFDDGNVYHLSQGTTYFSESQRKYMLEVFQQRKDHLREGGKITAKAGFLSPKYNLEYEGMYNVYARQFSKEKAADIRTDILKLMRSPIIGFVESLTYYFAMTSNSRSKSME